MFSIKKDHDSAQRNRVRRLPLSIAFFALLIGVFSACNVPIGLGDPVDTSPPVIVIQDPTQNKSFGVIVLGEAINISGIWSSDSGVTSLRAHVTTTTNSGEKKVYNNALGDYSIKKDGSWTAKIIVPEIGDGGEAEYTIKIFGRSKYVEEGSDEVTVRVDIMAPWVKSAWITRIPNTSIEQDTLYNKDYYTDLINFSNENAYRDIQDKNRDDFQNEFFTLKLEVNSNFSGVAATRLFVLDENDNILNSNYSFGMPPSRQPDDPKLPEWDITATDLAAWGGASFSSGPKYIHFEVWAWNGVEWGMNTPWNGEPVTHDSLSVRKQKINGTCWYPESDRPHIVVNNKEASTGFVTLDSGSNLSLSIFDDDKLKAIYAGLIPAEQYEEWRGSDTDAAYHESLRTNPAKRNTVISYLQKSLGKEPNLFTPVPGSADRDNSVTLVPEEAGDYRLIAMVLDDKSVYSDKSLVDSWGINNPLRVQVLDANKPIIIVDSPAENTFPILNNTSKFTLTGYTISRLETMKILAAWVPDGVNASQVEQLLVNASNDNSIIANGSAQQTSGIHIWKLTVGTRTAYELNDVSYWRNSFQKTFDVIDDFKVNGVIENKNKIFYFYAENSNGGFAIQAFRLSNYTEKPGFEITYPIRNLMVHNNKQDLVLSMKVTPKGIDIDPASIKIKDITGSSSDPEVNANANNYYFEEANPIQINGEYRRTVKFTGDRANYYFRDGSRRTYRFEANDILGNFISAERTIIMSNLPALMYITSTNASGVYGKDSELRFEAVFSMPVKMTSGGTSAAPKWPKLKLFFSDPGDSAPPTEAKVSDYADYVVSSSSSSTVVFTYKVPNDVYAEKLYTSLNPIDLNGAYMESTESGGGDAKIDFFDHADSLQNRVEIGLDGRRPTISSVAFSQAVAPNGLVWETGYSYFNKGKTLTLELKTSKQVRISGAPKAYLNIGTGTPVEAVFSSVSHSADGLSSTIRFTYTVADSVDVKETQVAWTSMNERWIATSDGSTITASSADTITDMYGNLIVLPNETTALNAEDYNGNNAEMRAFVITRAVPAPTFTLSNSSGTLQDVVRVNGNITINLNRNGGPTSSRLSYSVESGNNPRIIEGNATSATIIEKALDTSQGGSPNANLSTSYRPSQYYVTAWQEDLAGNRSPNAAERSVDINSRAPELDNITCGQANGVYRAGEKLTFKLAFSRPVRSKANGSASLTLKGTRTGAEDSITIDAFHGASVGAWDSIFTFNYTVETGKQLWDIKAFAISLSGFEDEYGNTLTNYVTSVTNETSVQRPLKFDLTNKLFDSFNLDRDSTWNGSTQVSTGLKIDSKGPRIIQYNPTEPVSKDQEYNGGVMGSGNNKITLKFDKAVWAQAGKNIIVRPWDKWAVPPVLSTVEFDALYNSAYYYVDKKVSDATNGTKLSNFERNTADALEYQRRLKWLDANGLPDAPYLGSDNKVQVHKYNFYTYTTKGLNAQSNTRVRPDINGQWVLAFRHDLYDGVDLLRDVFNAAHWKWQVIASTSSQVSISGDTVTIELRESLAPGRIWEVIMDAGAFRDEAGNDCAEIKPSAIAGDGYRFWSAGTEVPVIRVDRYSQGDHYKGVFDADLNGYIGYGEANRPKIDTRIRIDCETPGASIKYDTIRTSYTLAAAGSGTGTSNVLTTTDDTAAGFFGHFNAGQHGNATTGYANNTFGNGGSNTSQQSIPYDDDGYFKSLLVPNKLSGVLDTSLETHNGAILWSALKTKGDDLVSGFALSTRGSVYRTIGAGGIESHGAPVFSHKDTYTNTDGYFFYVGDAYKSDGGTGALADRNAAGDKDSRLFTGRRDYIAAAAQKKAVNTGLYSGPEQTVSASSYEGVYKTVWIFRNPNGTTNASGVSTGSTWRLVLQGFDTPVISKVPGFPLNESTFSSPGDESVAYFSKQAWRVGNYTNPVSMDPGTNSGQAGNSNNYIWVSWDIVCDWYQKGRAWYNATQSDSMQRNGYNYGAILSTYGGVTYRINQRYREGNP